MGVFAQQADQEDSMEELVDTVNTNGIDAFSDTTSVDSTEQSDFDTVYPTDTDDDDLSPVSKFFLKMLALTPLLMVLFMLVLFCFPVILIAVLLYLIVRHRNKQSKKQESINQNNNRVPNNHQTYDIEMDKKLRRSSTDRMIGGVCGGLAEYFDIDPTLVRVAYVLLTFFTAFSGLLVYIILLILMPQK
jgi:phage shock protein PspC (stress-responsive transcriptional regulator)